MTTYPLLSIITFLPIVAALIMAVFLTIMVGLSRMYLGVHYPSDVLAGWCVGGAWAVLCWTIALWLQRRGDVEQPGTTPFLRQNT